MSLEENIAIAASGMSAQTIRLNVTASNLANAKTTGGEEAKTYHAKYPVFSTVLNAETGASSVRVTSIVNSKAPLAKEYQPGNPMANAEGYVFLPNVNSVEEMANMISAGRDYQMNVEVLNTSKNLLIKTLNLLES